MVDLNQRNWELITSNDFWAAPFQFSFVDLLNYGVLDKFFSDGSFLWQDNRVAEIRDKHMAKFMSMREVYIKQCSDFQGCEVSSKSFGKQERTLLEQLLR